MQLYQALQFNIVLIDDCSISILKASLELSQKVETLKGAIWYDILINFVGWSSNLFVMVSMVLVCVIAVRRAVALYLPFKYNVYFR